MRNHEEYILGGAKKQEMLLSDIQDMDISAVINVLNQLSVEDKEAIKKFLK